jgi:outer membrane protein assembly factor BamB
MTLAIAAAVCLLAGIGQMGAPDSLVVPMWADTSSEIEVAIFPPANVLLPVSYQVAWGDGETLDWAGPLSSPTDISRYHRYRAAGDYSITVRARDSIGRVTGWGRPYSVSVSAEPILKGMFPTSDPIVASPALDLNGNIYIGDESGTFYSINPNGYERWRFTCKDAVYGSAAINRDMVIFGSLDSNLYCVDTLGKLRWQLNLQDEIYSPPAIGADGTVYAVTDKGSVVAIAPNGRKKWNYKTGDEIAGSPTIGLNGLIYVTSDSVYCLTAAGKRRWAYGTPEGDYFFASAVVDAGGTVRVGNTDGFLYCLGPDGRQQWRAPVPDGDEIRPEVVVGTDSALYFGTDGYYLCRMAPNGTPVAVYEAIDILISASAVSDKGTVYFLPDDGTLYAMAANGRLLWTREVAGGDKEVYYASSPVIGPDGTIYVGSWDGGVYAFRGDGPPAATLWPQYRHDAQHTGRTTKPATGR